MIPHDPTLLLIVLATALLGALVFMLTHQASNRLTRQARERSAG